MASSASEKGEGMTIPPKLPVIKTRGRKKKQSPKPVETSCIVPPWKLTPLGLEIWNRLIVGFEYTPERGYLLANYCESNADAIRATQDMNKNGPVALTSTGYEAQRPCVAMALKFRGLALKYAKDMGIVQGKGCENPNAAEAEFFGSPIERR